MAEKTVKEWLDLLPQPYSDLAYLNTRESALNSRVDSLYEALTGAFIWERTPQGEIFWRRVALLLTDTTRLN